MSLTQNVKGFLKIRAVQLIAVTALIVGVGTECFVTKLAIIDPDVWWHVSVGSWIVHHRSFPQTGLFSRTAADHPWRAYSWGYEVLISRAYEWFGFLGIGVFGTALTVAVALTVFWSLHRLAGQFWIAWMLSVIVYSAFLFNIAPRPVFLTAVLFTITLTLLFEAQQSGEVRQLFWLPLIFLFWANCHIQFFYGIATVGMFVGINLLQRVAMFLHGYPDFLLKPTLPLRPLFALLAACLLASCIGPYSFHLYQVVFGYATSKIIYEKITEFQALSFKFINQYIELMLPAAAFFVVGWQKRVDPFKLALLILGSIFAFRTWRDAWFICIPAAAVIADFRPPKGKRDESIRALEWGGIAAAGVLLLLLAVRNTDFNPRGLDRTISEKFPVSAVNFLRRNPVGGPLYNSFDWGGFLIFYMPEYPVSIDGRTDLYGDAMNEQYFATQEAEPSYATDPYLNEAGVVIFQNKFRLAHVLLTDRRFRVVYNDDLAIVLARNW